MALEAWAIGPEGRFAIFVRDMKQFNAYQQAGGEWGCVKVAYISSTTIREEHRELIEALHAVGVRVMISLAPEQDKIPNRKLRLESYRRVLELSPDIVETDYPVDFRRLIKRMEAKK